MFMFRSWLQQDYWHGESSIGPNITPGILRGYYRDLRGKTFIRTKIKSNQGIPLIRLQGKYILQPVTVCQVALGWYERWLDDDTFIYALDQFILLADWLVENSRFREHIGYVWPMQYGIATYSLAPGWISALVQGQAISVLIRAYEITKKDDYLQVASGATNPFKVSVFSGGGLFELSGGNIFFEEYPSHKGVHVLNGFISSLWGLYDYYLSTRDDVVKNIYLQGVTSLINSLPLFDTGYWSRYSLLDHYSFSNVASPYYHRAHISQLRATNIIHENSKFLEYANTWDNYLDDKSSVCRVVFEKSVSRIWYFFNEKIANNARQKF